MPLPRTVNTEDQREYQQPAPARHSKRGNHRRGRDTPPHQRHVEQQPCGEVMRGLRRNHVVTNSRRDFAARSCRQRAHERDRHEAPMQ